MRARVQGGLPVPRQAGEPISYAIPAFRLLPGEAGHSAHRSVSLSAVRHANESPNASTCGTATAA